MSQAALLHDKDIRHFDWERFATVRVRLAADMRPQAQHCTATWSAAFCSRGHCYTALSLCGDEVLAELDAAMGTGATAAAASAFKVTLLASSAMRPSLRAMLVQEARHSSKIALADGGVSLSYRRDHVWLSLPGVV